MSEFARPPYPNISSCEIDSFEWPDGKACGVTIAWHIDGEAGPVGCDLRAARHVAAVSEAAYGVITALPRILELHRELSIPGTFFVPAHVVELHPAAIEAILADGHEIAHHGYMHENVFPMDGTQQREIFEHATSILQAATGRSPRGWSAPGWGVNAETLEVILDLGMLYDASLMERDRPYVLELSQGELVELPISMILDDWALFGASLYPAGSAATATAEEARCIWQEEFDGMRHFGSYFNTTFHPNLLGRPGRMLMLKTLLTYMRSFDDVWWGTCEQLALHVGSITNPKKD
jgi:peptidoglycan/xylan/chitin deacetylase (PgdA/CDA1 family)